MAGGRQRDRGALPFRKGAVAPLEGGQEALEVREQFDEMHGVIYVDRLRLPAGMEQEIHACDQAALF